VKVGDRVYGKTKKAEMPKEGGIIKRVISKDFFYIDRVSGGGIGMRDEKELTLKKGTHV
jgi:hypothetical protein